jgi:hypothetical protein
MRWKDKGWNKSNRNVGTRTETRLRLWIDEKLHGPWLNAMGFYHRYHRTYRYTQ